MNSSKKITLSTLLTAMLILSMATTAMLPVMGAISTYGFCDAVEVINPATGDKWFNYTTTSPPPTAAEYPLGYVIANVTVKNVTWLSAWQLRLTWNSSLLEIAKDADIYLPADNVFAGYEDPVGLDRGVGYVFWICGIAIGAPWPAYNGSGVLCQIKFNVTMVPSSTLSCDLVLDRVTAGFYTMLSDPDANEIEDTWTGGKTAWNNGYYEYKYIVPPPPKPWLEAIDPLDGDHLVVKGEPLGPPLVYPDTLFDVDILAKNFSQVNDVIAVQTLAVVYNNTLVNCTDVTEGTFFNNPTWAPFGTDFAYVIDRNDPPGSDSVYIVLVINPNDTLPVPDWNWPERPTGNGLLCTLHFEVIHQEEFPWEGGDSINLMEMFPNEMFLNTTLYFIEHSPPVDAAYKIMGYVVGRMIDVYVGDECEPYPYPYGGQGINRTADMFWPQKKVCMWANVTYNMWPVQNKTVTFEIRDPDWNIVTVLSAETDTNGVAYASFRIPWPEHAKYLCHVYTIIVSVDIACTTVKDWLWFHFDYLVRWKEQEYIVTPSKIPHCQEVTITVKFKSKAMQYYDVLITIDLKDELQVPIGFDMEWIRIGGAEWCHYEPYEWTFTFHIHKHAFAGVATVHINALSNLPSCCGCAYCPESRCTFVILAQ